MDDIHDMMDDISEQNEIAEEISNALSQPIGFGAEVDEVRATKHFYGLTTIVLACMGILLPPDPSL